MNRRSKDVRFLESLRRILVPAESPHLTRGEAFEGLEIPWPKGLEPKPRPLRRRPFPEDELPKVDVIAMMDTAAEAEAMSDVFTPGFRYNTDWYRYAHDFDSYKRLFGPNAPANDAPYLGQYLPVQIGGLKVLVYKTNLHFQTDGRLIDGRFTVPLAKVLKQMIAEAEPALFLTTGTSGGVYCSMQLGDVTVTRAAHFLCRERYADAPFNGKTFRSDWEMPRRFADKAHSLMQRFAGQLTGKGDPPNARCNCNRSKGHPTRIFFDGHDGIAPFHPVITTDFFDFGTSTNHLNDIGIAVEMDDAVLGLVASQLRKPPRWASVRNLSDPCIDGRLDERNQMNCADFYYETYGYWTTVMSGITTWSIIAGLEV